MKHTIQQFLKKIETERGIKIHYAFESGSRAWGFPSPDSDYDIRFLYTHPKDSYFELNPKKDQITLPMQGLLDGSGWEMTKFLRLMYSSNATPFEWLQSDIVYRENSALQAELWDLSQSYVQPKKLIFHYIGIAKGMLEREFQGDTVKIKKYFYVLRPVLAACWVARYEEAPPLDFYQLLPLLENEQSVLAAVHALLKEKETADEGFQVPKVSVIDDYVLEAMALCKTKAEAMEKKLSDWTAINRFWKDFLGKL